MAFLSFVSNITGHVATLAGKITGQDMSDTVTEREDLYMPASTGVFHLQRDTGWYMFKVIGMATFFVIPVVLITIVL
ncbi:hypothetical protein [Chitinophaga agri]|uniref:Uncharacterized protein n=1 Tax=Chitinophaga agri TaxID=2703787 RepID=A0A6B9ZKF6_9BACT|nr:hypothetical protein [Chitinophaga agri]QHS61113.1 hypothetical protein GWR21_16355 [Chitinophaga agri]